MTRNVPKHRIPGPKLPLFTYHITTQWPNGDIINNEHKLDRDDALDLVADAIETHGCCVEVMMVERDDYGRPFAVKDVTDNMLDEWRKRLAERGLTDGEPGETPLEAARTRAEEAYDSRVSDELMGLGIR